MAPLLSRIACFTATIALTSQSCLAADDFFTTLDVNNNDQALLTEPTWGYKGYIKQSVQYGLAAPSSRDGFARNKTGWSEVQSDGFLEFRGDFNNQTQWQFSVKAESDWLEWRDDTSRWHGHNQDLRLKDAFVDYVFNNGLWLRLGNQVFAWGEAEGLAITDALSPTDQRTPGQAELRDIREPIPAFFLSAPLGQQHKISLVLTHHAKANRYASKGEPFDLFAGFREQGLTFNSKSPHSEWEYAVKLDAQYNASDVSLVLARVNDNTFGVGQLELTSRSVWLTQNRVSIVGASANRAIGNWLIKGEAAYWQDVATPTNTDGQWPSVDQTRGMIGLEYSGWRNCLAALEVNTLHSLESVPNNISDTTELGYVARLQFDAMNEKFNIQWWLMQLANLNGQIARWDMHYALSDAWQLKLTAVAYQINDSQSLFYPFRNHDSLALSATLQF